jgi:N-formylglutamate deformylase
MTSTIINIPHSSTVIPLELKDQFELSNDDLEHEVRLMSDHFTDELFISDVFKDTAVVFPISRICVDPERFRDDAEEIMVERGMGVIYTHSNDGSPIRRSLTDSERLRLLTDYYDPHHIHLEKLVGRMLEISGKVLIIDCHSFPDRPLPYELDQSLKRPDICIGTDEFHTPQWLINDCVRLYEHYDLKTTINKPFKGSLVPVKYYRSNKNVLSVMIEVNRKLYLNEDTALKNDSFGKIQKIIQVVLESLQL